MTATAVDKEVKTELDLTLLVDLDKELSCDMRVPSCGNTATWSCLCSSCKAGTLSCDLCKIEWVKL